MCICSCSVLDTLHTSLNNIQIRGAKPEAKAYTFGDGKGLSLLIEPNGSKSWRFRYRFADKPKMISLGVCPTITPDMPVPVVTMPENWSPKEGIRVRFERSRKLLYKQILKAHSKRSPKNGIR